MQDICGYFQCPSVQAILFDRTSLQWIVASFNWTTMCRDCPEFPCQGSGFDSHGHFIRWWFDIAPNQSASGQRCWLIMAYGHVTCVVSTNYLAKQQTAWQWVTMQTQCPKQLLPGWGDADRGGDCSDVQDQLVDVQHICSTGGAFAATLKDGSIITWGSPDYGGDFQRLSHRFQKSLVL